jgi:hypothetical protein
MKMTVVRKSLPLLLGVIVGVTVLSLDALAVDKDKIKFAPPELESLETKLNVSDVTIGVKPFDRETLAESAFGKVNPYEHGILPILLIVKNNSKQAIRLDTMKVEYHDRDKRRIESIAAAEVPYTRAPDRPTFGGPQIPGLSRRKKNPLAAPEIELRAFAAKMLPPGESAHGFVYFRTGHRSGSNLYVTGLREAGSGKELFFFEIPLD